ncbi:MAG: bifunctional RNase H/acid phosphatase [Acidothermaceae bacterium]
MSAAATSGRRLIVEADGGSRSNPGPAGYGAVVLDAATGEVLREASDFLGVATNNFAEYSGLIAGLRAAHEVDAGAYIEVRMDSRLVVEQMSGRWQIKHPDLRPLAREAAGLASAFGPGHVKYSWIPRERNKMADRLANLAMDAGTGQSRAVSSRTVSSSGASSSGASSSDTAAVRPRNRIVGWGPAVEATSLVLVRHGVTGFTLEKRFCGISDPPLVEQGRLEAKAVAERLSSRGGIDLIVSSPMSRCRETAALIAAAVGAPVEYDDELREVSFGAWEGLTFSVVQERWPRELELWLGDTSISPPDGESYDSLRHRCLAAQQRIVNRHRGHTICLVTHSRVVAMFTVNLLDASTDALYRLPSANASVSELDYYEDGPSVLRTFNDISHLR